MPLIGCLSLLAAGDIGRLFDVLVTWSGHVATIQGHSILDSLCMRHTINPAEHVP